LLNPPDLKGGPKDWYIGQLQNIPVVKFWKKNKFLLGKNF